MKKDFVVTEQTARWIELHDSMDVIWRGIESGLEEVTGERGKAKEAFEKMEKPYDDASSVAVVFDKIRKV